MKFLETELEKINDSDLTPENRIKKKQFIKLAKLLSYLPIQDSQNFKKVFDMYRLPLAKL